ncbi:response regulator transcription factor [Hydrogenobacter thermophilus]|uniref:response regulator transcription factor n=1 Tax=Hydrogenobacter thermophilus TaxID=940 RepID=UPI0030F7C401
MRVLLVEDDTYVGEMIKEGLQYEGYSVVWVRDGFSAIREVTERDYDIVLLDIMLPKFDGIKVLRRIREVKDTPVIMITAKSQVEDKVEGLSAGADDYITKPFSFKEVLARINAVLRRCKKEEEGVIKIGDLVINPRSYEVYYRGQSVKLTNREFKLLKVLAEHAGEVLSRERLFAKVWGSSYGENSNVVDVYIKNLRNKLEDRPPKLIHTIRGMGYMLKPQDVS